MGKTKGGLGFSKASLKTTLTHLRENCYFNVGNVKMKKAIEIPMGIDPTPFCSNLCLYSYEEESCHHYFLLIKSRQDISTQQSASLMVFALEMVLENL